MKRFLALAAVAAALACAGCEDDTRKSSEEKALDRRLESSNGIAVGRPKVYDDSVLQQMLNAAETQLASLQLINQTGIANNFGTITGANQQISSFAFSAQAGPPSATTAVTDNGPTTQVAGKVLQVVPDSLREAIFGLAEDRNGGLWVATANHVLQVKRAGLMGSALSDKDVREYGLADGLSSMEGVKRFQSVVVDSQGRVWFSTDRGLSIVNPARGTANSVPALVHIEEVSVDGGPFDTRGSIRLPAGNHRMTFRYVGLSLGNSDRVHYRYMLEGFDHVWSQAVTNREATYGNLGAGTYRFRVMASNSDGLWDASEAAVRFEVEPTLWQMWWFQLACALSAGLMALLLYRLRVHRVTRLLNVRFEERLAERVRVAQELHDTLLQSFHGVLLRFQAASNVLPARPEEAKQRLDSAIDLAAQAIAEGRDSIQGLRSSTVVTNDLAMALSALGEELAANETNHNSALFDVEVEGAPRELHPILRDEIYRIAGEALRNAFRHSQAQRIELEIRYDENQLRLRIRDDGKGMDSRVVDDASHTGHWGLLGMRERTKLVGGNLEVWSKPDSGTEIELSIPASTAYTRSTNRRRFWFSRKGTATHS